MDDEDPKGMVEVLRRLENLPHQYRSVYECSTSAVKQFVFILNDSGDENKFFAASKALGSQFKDATYEIKMSGQHPKC